MRGRAGGHKAFLRKGNFETILEGGVEIHPKGHGKGPSNRGAEKCRMEALVCICEGSGSVTLSSCAL